jgi:hypothetical protein
MRRILCLDGPLEGQYFELNEGLSTFQAHQYKYWEATIGSGVAEIITYIPKQWAFRGENQTGFMIWVAWCGPTEPTLDVYLTHVLKPTVLAVGEYWDGMRSRKLGACVHNDDPTNMFDAPEECDAHLFEDGPVSKVNSHCRCAVCPRCGHHTGNNTQGHYWAFCKATRTNREFHHCCSDPAFGCELEAKD